MAFRVQRLHGHKVSPDVFKNFKNGGEFVCFVGQSTQAVTGMYNLFRASQVLFPGEKILEDAKNYASKFLTEKRAVNELFDKWIITKDLPGEVGYALDVPWYASLPRLETRFFIEQYGGKDDVWIGKSLYRMPFVNNDVYLELAKLDYNNCQAVHCAEWEKIQRWYMETGLEEFGLSKESLLVAYFVAAGSIFEPERSLERLGWAKTAALIATLTSFVKDEEPKRNFVDLFNNSINRQDFSNKSGLEENNAKEEKLLEILLVTLDYLGLELFRVYGQEVSDYLNQIWQRWFSSWQIEGGNGFEREAELIVETINLTAGCYSEEIQQNPQYQKLLELTNSVGHRLRNYQTSKTLDSGSITTSPEMQELVQMVLLQDYSDGIQMLPSSVKSSFLIVAKSFYYAAYFDPETIMSHIDKVLFQKVM